MLKQVFNLLSTGSYPLARESVTAAAEDASLFTFADEGGREHALYAIAEASARYLVAKCVTKSAGSDVVLMGCDCQLSHNQFVFERPERGHHQKTVFRFETESKIMNKNTFTFTGDRWEDYADEHILLMRENVEMLPITYEMVKVTKNPDDDETVLLLHEVIFMSDYVDTAAGRKATDEILKGFGYEGLDDFVAQTSDGATDDWVRKPDGTVDLDKSPSYIIDLPLLASLICEHHEDGIAMTEAKALAEVERMTGRTFPCTGCFTKD